MEPTEETSASVEPYVQLVHKGCKGEVVVMSRASRLCFACKKCRATWIFDAPTMFPINSVGIPSDWVTPTSEQLEVVKA